MAGVVILGLGYLTYKYFDGLPKTEIPLPKEAEKFSEFPSVKPSSVDEIAYNEEVRKRAIPLLEKSLWRDAVRESAVALFDVLRSKSGIDEDATTLVRKAFRGAKCKLKFVGIAPSHITNADEGLIHYLEGFCTHTRKIHMHASVQVSKEDALWMVNLAAYLADQIENNTVQINPSNSSEITN